MRITSIAAVICALVASTTEGGSEGDATPPPAGHSNDAKAMPTSADDKVITISGMVRNPHAIPMTEGLTVSKAIEVAGGFANFADPRRVLVYRGKEDPSFTVDVKAVLQKKADAKDPLLEAGDQVYVPTQFGDY